MRPGCSPELPAIKLGAERATRKPNRAIIGRVLCRLSYLGVLGVSGELTLSRSQNECIASNAYPAKPGAGAGSRTPVSSLPKMCPVQTGRRQQCGAGGVTRKLNHRVTNAALFLLSYTSGYGAGDRTRTGVWTTARSHLSHWKTPASWSGVRESNSSGWFGRPVPKALGQPRLKPSYELTCYLVIKDHDHQPYCPASHFSPANNSGSSECRIISAL